MIAEREEHRFAGHAFRGLNDVGMMANDQVGAVFDQPSRGVALAGVGPVEQFAAPVDVDDHQFGQRSCEPEFLTKSGGGNLIARAVASGNVRESDKRDGVSSQPLDDGGIVEGERLDSGIAQCRAGGRAPGGSQVG
jgi:hypothetical protein